MTDKNVRADEVRIPYTKLTAYHGQELNLGCVSNFPSHAYSWKKDGAVIVGQTGKYLRIAVAEDSSGSYTCTVSKSDGSTVDSDAMVLTSKAKPVELVQEFEAKFLEYKDLGTTHLDFSVVQKMRELINTAKSADGKNVADIFEEKLESDYPELYTIHCAMVKCNGKLLVQESRDGYFDEYTFTMDSNTDYQKGAFI